MAFKLDETLAADTVSLGVRNNIDIRIMRDARYFWLVLVPQINGAVEWHDLSEAEALALHQCCMQTAGALRDLANADKMNIAALGNMVRQLHVHIIARHESDYAWPGPIWGVGDAQAFTPIALQTRIAVLKTALALSP